VALVSPPAGHGRHDQSKRGDIHNRWSLHDRLRVRPPRPRPSSGTLRARRNRGIPRGLQDTLVRRGKGACNPGIQRSIPDAPGSSARHRYA
jgi:hypothetical protein